MARRAPRLVDQFGRALSYTGLYEAGNYSRAREYSGSYLYAGVDTEQALDTYQIELMRTAGRYLAANVPTVRGALLEQANFSLPLSAHFAGPDQAFGNLAEEWVYEWQKNNNVRGPMFNSQVTGRLRLFGRKVDGDIFTALIQSNKGDFPKVQLIRAHRVGDRYGYNAVIKDGPYKGQRSKMGVIYDAWMRPQAYCVLGKDKSEDQYISANHMFPSFRPDVSDIIRAPSELASCIRPFSELKRLFDCELRSHQAFSALGLIEHNETGYADEASDALNDGNGTPSTSSGGLITEEFEEGMVRYFKAKSGAGLTAFHHMRPAKDAQDWWDKILSFAFYGMEWDPNFALCLKQPGGAWVRAIMRKICMAIANNVAVEAYAQEVEIAFAVGQAIKDKVLPEPKDGNFHTWNIELGIPLPTADSGNEEAAIRESYKIGFTTLQAIASRSGGWWRDLRKQKETELRDLIGRATAIQADFPEMTVKEIMHLLEQRDSNAPAAETSDGAIDLVDGAEGEVNDPDRDFKRNAWLAMARDATAGDVMANLTDLKKLTEDVGLPMNREYVEPYLPVVASDGLPVTGAVVRDKDGDIVGGDAEGLGDES